MLSIKENSSMGLQKIDSTSNSVKVAIMTLIIKSLKDSLNAIAANSTSLKINANGEFFIHDTNSISDFLFLNLKSYETDKNKISFFTFFNDPCYKLEVFKFQKWLTRNYIEDVIIYKEKNEDGSFYNSFYGRIS